MQFSTNYEYLENELSATREFQQVLTFEDFFPAENYYRIYLVDSVLKWQHRQKSLTFVFLLK
jgi:hypothetical protein